MVGDLTPFDERGRALLHAESSIPFDNRLANGRLIESAPELLKEVRQLAARLDNAVGGTALAARRARELVAYVEDGGERP